MTASLGNKLLMSACAVRLSPSLPLKVIFCCLLHFLKKEEKEEDM